MNSNDTTNQVTKRFSRFLIKQGSVINGKYEKNKTVGTGYLCEGHIVHTLRLWTFLDQKYYLVPDKTNGKLFSIMTREPNKSPKSQNKYLWNVVGTGKLESQFGHVRLDFHLLDKPLFMNIFPEMKVTPKNLFKPEEHFVVL